jgi:hypothetical protein
MMRLNLLGMLKLNIKNSTHSWIKRNFQIYSRIRRSFLQYDVLFRFNRHVYAQLLIDCYLSILPPLTLYLNGTLQRLNILILYLICILLFHMCYNNIIIRS